MNIAFCLGSMGKGGAERVVANLSNYLVEKKNQVTIITTSIKESVYELDDRIELLHLDREDQKKNFILKNAERLQTLRKYLKKVKPDIIISLLPEPSFRILLLKDVMKTPVIVSVRNDPNIEYKSKLNKFFMKILYPKANGFIFQTEQAKEYFREDIQKKSIIIPNPISEEFIKEESVEQSQTKEKIVINVGRLEKQKNQEMLIKAFKEVNRKHPEYQLHIYGEGSLRGELQQLIEQKHLEKNVKLCGQSNDIKKQLQRSEIFVLSSDYEGMPNSLMEAMAMGLACISTDCPCGGPKFLIKDKENGYLVEVGKQKKLEEAMETLITNKEYRSQLAQEAIKIRERLNPRKIYTEWEEYIKKVEKGEKEKC